MKLHEWRRSRGLSQQQMASLIATSQSMVARFEGGTRIPRVAIMEKIVSVTAGEVMPNDFYPAAASAERAA